MDGMELDSAHDSSELQQWAVLLRAARSTLVEVLLEQRPIHFVEILTHGLELSVNDETEYCPNCNRFDYRFCEQILHDTFDDGKAWPTLQKLTLRGLNLTGFEYEYGEELSSFAARVLPGIHFREKNGNYMFFNPDTGTIENVNGVDGMKPQLDLPWLQ